MRISVALYLRVKSPIGRWIYVKPVLLPSHKLKALHGIVNGVPTRCPEGSYHLRYRVEGKRLWLNVGTVPDVALAALQRKVAELDGAKYGLIVAAGVQDRILEAAPLGRSMKQAVEDYILETKAQKSAKTLAAYQTTLDLFLSTCHKPNIENIERKDLLAYVTLLRDRGNAPRTIRNRVDYLQNFPTPLRA